MSRLLYDENPLLISPSLAEKIGLNEAIVLQQIHYWLTQWKNSKRTSNYRDGKWWVYNTNEQWKKNFPFWSESTIWRTLKKLRDMGLIVATDEYNKMKYDRTLWYSIDYEKTLEIESSIVAQSEEGAFRQGDPAEHVRVEDASGQNDETENAKVTTPIPEITTKTNTETKTETTRADGAGNFSEDQNKPEDENREPDKFDLMTKEELRKLFEPYGGEEPPPELTVEEENQKLTEMGIVGDNPFGLDEMSPEEYFQALPKIRERLRSEGINAPVDWVIATSRERGADHIREENERRQELKRQGRDLELEQAVANVRSWMPPETVELAVVFVEKTRMTPVVSDRRAWMKAFSDMHKKGVIPKDLKSGIGRMKEKGLMIKSPFSVATSAINQMGIRKVEEDRYKIG